MKFTIHRDKLARIAGLAATAIASKPTRPIEAMILLDARGGSVLARGTDLARTLTSTEQATTDKPGTIAVAKSDLLSAVGAMPVADIEVEYDGKRLVFLAGKRRIAVPCVDGEEFPRVPVVKPDAPSIVVEVARLASVLRRSSYARCLDHTRPVMYGTMLEFPGDVVRAVASDGHKLAVAEDACDGVTLESAMIPFGASTVIEGMVCADKGDDHIKIAHGGALISVKRGETEIVAQLAEHGFLYGNAIPQAFKSRAVMQRNDLHDAAKAVIAAAQSISGCRAALFDFAAGRLSLVAADKRDARGADEIGCAFEGESLRVGLNAEYVIETINALRTDDMVIEMAGDFDPVVFREHGDGASKSVHIVMPVRPEWVDAR